MQLKDHPTIQRAQGPDLLRVKEILTSHYHPSPTLALQEATKDHSLQRIRPVLVHVRQAKETERAGDRGQEAVIILERRYEAGVQGVV